MAAGPAAENAVFMLKTNEIYIIDIQKVSSTAIGFDILFRKFKANAIGVLVSIVGVIDRKGNACRILVLGGDRFAQIGSEGCDATPARQIIADECNSLNDGVGGVVQQTK